MLWLLLALLGAACAGEPAATDGPLVPTQADGPSGTSAIPGPTSMPPNMDTNSSQPAPTATTATPGSMTTTPTPAECEFGWFFQPEPDSCPAGQPTASAAAEQPFENGVMIWLEETDSIVVFHDDGRWQRFEDSWTEGEPESDPAIIPPEGRFQPIRGFGKLWRQRPDIREALGWAVGVELGFESTVQDQALAPDRPPLIYLRTYNGQIFALIGRASDQGDWVVAADNR